MLSTYLSSSNLASRVGVGRKSIIISRLSQPQCSSAAGLARTYVITMNPVILILVALIVTSQQAVIPRNNNADVPEEIVIKTAIAEDSPVVLESGICTGGLQMDISGVCREVWFGD